MVIGNTIRPHDERRKGRGAGGLKSGGKAVSGSGSVGKGGRGDGAGFITGGSVGKGAGGSVGKGGTCTFGAGSVGTSILFSTGLCKGVRTTAAKNPTINTDTAAAMVSNRSKDRCPNPTNCRKSTHLILVKLFR